MVKTFREVLQNIKPGETWDCINDCNIKSISYIDKSIRIEYCSSIICYVLDDAQFKLRKEEVEFEDAIKALKEGKTIESCETERMYKTRERGDEKVIFVNTRTSSTWLDLDIIFKQKEVFGKWCIYNEGEI
jgi:hypothetical protein|nr:MAG TPA: hypothetical protein [Caudoviricetes sp.]